MSEPKYEVLVFWDKADDIFVAEVPELRGCMAHGATRAEALTNVENAMQLWLATAKEDGLYIPEPRGKLIFA